MVINWLLNCVVFSSPLDGRSEWLWWLLSWWICALDYVSVRKRYIHHLTHVLTHSPIYIYAFSHSFLRTHYYTYTYNTHTVSYSFSCSHVNYCTLQYLATIASQEEEGLDASIHGETVGDFGGKKQGVISVCLTGRGQNDLDGKNQGRKATFLGHAHN